MSDPRLNVRAEGTCEHSSLQEVINECVKFYHGTLRNYEERPATSTRRKQLALWVRKFHRDCGTLTARVEEAIERLSEEPCLVVMSAHQPNLFAYSGVMRKATLEYFLAQKLSKSLNLPAVSYFGLADQDFTDDRWVKSALIPDVERRAGVLELRLSLPEKMMLNRVGKPSKIILDNWRNEIERWIERKLNAVKRLGKSFGIKVNVDSVHSQNFDDFWKIVGNAADKAKVYSDFNAFIMSHIVNNVWGYDTLFCRFSECQRVFEREFSVLVSRFEEYSRFVGEAILRSEDPDKGVFERESIILPFWLHCECGSKARLTASYEEGRLSGYGKCLRCEKEYCVDLGISTKRSMKEILSRISARSMIMPLVFLDGLKVGCYVGGIGGTEYLRQARYVAENMRLAFPPVVVWRPRDLYFGLGQLEALMVFKGLSGTFDVSQYSAVKTAMTKKIASVQWQVEELELWKTELSDSVHDAEKRIEKIRALTVEQVEIRRKANLPVLMRNAVLLENVKSVLHLYPSIIDYVVNIGLKDVSEQWIAFLEKNGDLSSSIKLNTSFDESLPMLSRDFLSEVK